MKDNFFDADDVIQSIRPDETAYLAGVCAHEKVYADFIYATYPPIRPWICAVCGLKGEERASFPPGPSYQEIVEKFRDR